MPNTPVPAAATGLPKFNREKVEKAIEKLILLLDLTDPDPDLEESNDNEPFLAATVVDDKIGGTDWAHAQGSRIDTSDRENESEHDEDGHDREHDPVDLEPYLGWTQQEARTGKYPTGWHVNQDLEQQHDGCEPEEDQAADDVPCDGADECEPGNVPTVWPTEEREVAACGFGFKLAPLERKHHV